MARVMVLLVSGNLKVQAQNYPEHSSCIKNNIMVLFHGTWQ
jgi:hypothetical protein